MGTWSDRLPNPVTPIQKEKVNTVSKVFPDAVAAVVVVAATVAATSWAGHVVSGQDLVALFGMVMGYVFGKNASGA